MKVLVSGSDGLLGSNIVNYILQKTDIHVELVCVDNRKRYGNINRPYQNNPRVEYLAPVDVCDLVDYKINDIDVVIHCAYDIGGIKHWCDDHEGFYKRNKHISDRMIKWIETISPQQVIWMSSSQVYENMKEFPSTEFNINNLPTSGYAKEKFDAERSCLKSNFSDRLLILRPFNCVGKEEIKTNNQNHVVPDIVKKVLDSKGVKPIKLYGDGSQVRHFTMVSDFADAIHKSISLQLYGTYNVCGSHKMTMKELAEKIWRLTYEGINPMIEYDMKMIDEDVRYREGDDSPFRSKTGWTESQSFDQMLREMIWTQQMSS